MRVKHRINRNRNNRSGIRRCNDFLKLKILNLYKNIIHSFSFSHVQPCCSLFQPCLSLNAALRQHGLGFFSASPEFLFYSLYKVRILKRLMIIAKFYSIRKRWGVIPRFTGKSPPLSRDFSEKNNK